ncbi:MAG: SHOCT domain-containing protein [Clostridia bacterium]|nr:SHOCT domain-containing protein [Clostridia bacterium]
MEQKEIVLKGKFEFDYSKIIWNCISIALIVAVFIVSLYYSPRLLMASLFIGKSVIAFEIVYWIVLIGFAVVLAVEIKLEMIEKDSLGYRSLTVFKDGVSYVSGYFKSGNKYSSFDADIAQLDSCLHKRKKLIFVLNDKQKHIIKHLANSYDVYMCISKLMRGEEVETVAICEDTDLPEQPREQNGNGAESNKGSGDCAVDEKALRQLKSLLDDGIITQEEYEAKKKRILGL